jgi:hypothetical protein
VSDIRHCTLCDRYIDIEAPGMRVVSRGTGRKNTVISVDGTAHSVSTKRISERRKHESAQARQIERASE